MHIIYYEKSWHKNTGEIIVGKKVSHFCSLPIFISSLKKACEQYVNMYIMQITSNFFLKKDWREWWKLIEKQWAKEKMSISFCKKNREIFHNVHSLSSLLSCVRLHVIKKMIFFSVAFMKSTSSTLLLSLPLSLQLMMLCLPPFLLSLFVPGFLSLWRRAFPEEHFQSCFHRTIWVNYFFGCFFSFQSN